MKKERSKNSHLALSVLFLALWFSGCSSGGDPQPEMASGDPEMIGDEPELQDPDLPQDDPEMSTENLGTQIVINEFVPSNANGAADETGAKGDWIELFNLTDSAVDLAGYFISDKLDNPTKQELGGGLVIEAGGTLVLWADSDVEQGPNHLSFNLSKEGEAIVLTSPLGDVLDSIDYVNATTDSSFARVPDGVGAFGFCNFPTPDAPNDPACGP